MSACYNMLQYHITASLHHTSIHYSSGHNIILSQLHSAICTCSLTPVMEGSRYVDIQSVCCDVAAVCGDISRCYTG